MKALRRVHGRTETHDRRKKSEKRSEQMEGTNRGTRQKSQEILAFSCHLAAGSVFHSIRKNWFLVELLSVVCSSRSLDILRTGYITSCLLLRHEHTHPVLRFFYQLIE